MTARPGLPGFRAVFFDLDGTLYDERGGMLRALDETLGLIAELVVGLDVAAAKRLYPEVGRAIWETADLTAPGPDPRARTQELRCRVWGLLMERCGCPVAPDLAARLAAIYSEARFRHHRLFPEATEVLDRLDSLKAGNGILRVGLITNGASDLQRDKLAACALAERFDPVLISAEVGVAKPSAEIFHEALERCGVAAGEALYVGDSPDKDVAGARSAGLAAAWVNRTEAPFPPGLPEPTWEIRDLRSVPDIVSGSDGESA